MLAVEPSERYNAENVAKHPFITGKSNDIPLSSWESVKAFRNQDNLLNVGLILILSINPKFFKNNLR